jgi:hypothetical protein
MTKASTGSYTVKQALRARPPQGLVATPMHTAKVRLYRENANDKFRL